MPICTLLTNVPDSDVPEGFEAELCHLLAETLEKPIERISVVVQPGQRMVRAGTSEATCLLNIWSIAIFNIETNPVYAEKLYPFLAKNLGIENDRIVVLFHDIASFQVAKPRLNY